MSVTREEVHRRRDGSTYVTIWTKTDYFCTECGERSVWEDDCHDYYLGTDHVCAECGARFRHPTGRGPVPEVLK